MSDLQEGRAKILQRFDEVYEELASSVEDESIRLMLQYTHQLHRLWRPLLGVLPLPEGGRFLDVGTGSGLVPLEIATTRTIDAVGFDIESRYIAFAERFREALLSEGILDSTSQVDFRLGDLANLSLESESFDVILVREVLQFLVDPQAATDSLFQASKPGAIICMSDLDDQLFVSYPEHSDAFSRMFRSIGNVQRAQGGDREIGRKLSYYLSQSGFAIQSVFAIPQARHFVETENDPERLFVIEQMKEARERVVSSGEMSDAQFTALIEQIENEPQCERYRFNARLVAIGQKPRA